MGAGAVSLGVKRPEREAQLQLVTRSKMRGAIISFPNSFFSQVLKQEENFFFTYPMYLYKV